MAIRFYLIPVLFFSSKIFLGQLKIIDINLDKQKSIVEIIADSSFYIENESVIKIKYEGDGHISRIINSEGTIKRISKDYYSISFPDSTKSVVTLIKIYEKTPKGKQHLLISKPYKLIRVPPPVISIGGVKNDSSINIEHLFRDNTVRAFDTTTKKPLPIHSFTINFSETDTVRIKGHKIPLKVKPMIYNLKEGTELKITNIYSILPDNRIYKTPSITIFLIKNDQYSVGERKYINN